MIGQTIGQYRIESMLEKRGMGEAFLARDTSLDRKVAIKFLPLDLQQDELSRRSFSREARSAAAPDHPFPSKNQVETIGAILHRDRRRGTCGLKLSNGISRSVCTSRRDDFLKRSGLSN